MTQKYCSTGVKEEGKQCSEQLGTPEWRNGWK